MEETWENGQAFADLAARMDAIAEQREAIETERKVRIAQQCIGVSEVLPAVVTLSCVQAMRKRLPPPEPWATPTTRSRRSSAGAGATSSIARSNSAALTTETDGFLSQPEYVARDEVFKVCAFVINICQNAGVAALRHSNEWGQTCAGAAGSPEARGGQHCKGARHPGDSKDASHQVWIPVVTTQQTAQAGRDAVLRKPAWGAVLISCPVAQGTEAPER